MKTNYKAPGSIHSSTGFSWYNGTMVKYTQNCVKLQLYNANQLNEMRKWKKFSEPGPAIFVYYRENENG